MRHLITKLKELEQRELKVVVSRGALALQQTQRNEAKSEIIEALYKDIKEAAEAEGYQVYITAEGPILEFLNLGVEDQVLRMAKDGEKDIYTGFASIQFDAIMKNLDTNGELDQEDYRITREAKRQKEEAKQKAKEQKMQRDAEIRAERARRREEEIMRIAAMKIEQED